MSRPLFVGWTDDRERPTDEPDGQPSVRYTLSEDARATGMHVIGGPGTGKTKFLEHCIRQDIHEGRGVGLIDPHGELYDNVLTWCAYLGPSLSTKIIPLNLSSSRHVVSFNPFAGVTGGDVHVPVNRAIETIVRAWGAIGTNETPTLERILRGVFHAILESGLTIAEAGHLLSFDNRQLREYLTSRITDRAIREEWAELAGLKDAVASDTAKVAARRDWRSQILSTKNKLLRFITARSMLRFLSLTESIDVRRIMDESAVLLVRLGTNDTTLDAIDARVFGSLLVSKFFAVARSRGGLGKPLPEPFYLYCDEFQNFVSPDVAEILPQGRKFGLSLILAHQFLGQLEAQETLLVDAVMATARTKVTFGGLSSKDAMAMVPELFAGQYDYHEVKRIDYSVKFWPVSARDQVYTTGTGRGYVSTLGGATSDAEQWLPAGEPGATVHTQQSHWTDAENETESESVADVPIIRHVPFIEGKETPWSLEEQKQRLADALMLQLQRHCFVKPRDGQTAAVLVPPVKDFPQPVATVLNYEAEHAKKAGALTPARVDQITAERTKQLEHQALLFAEEISGAVHSKGHEPQPSSTRAGTPQHDDQPPAPLTVRKQRRALNPLRPKATPEGSDGEEG